MGKQWTIAAAALLGWVIVSMYFVMSGTTPNLPPQVTSVLPYLVVALLALFVFFRFRKAAGAPSLDRANLWSVLSGSALLTLLGFAFVTFGRDSHIGMLWVYAAIALAPVALLLFLRYRQAMRDTDKNNPYGTRL